MEGEPLDHDIIELVINRMEEFWMGDGEDSGEAEFNRFAEKYAHIFIDEDFLSGTI